MSRIVGLAFLCGLLTLLCGLPSAEAQATGPATEKRFPPLRVPPGFRATLFACDPLVEYPSVIALGPRPGSLYVAHDYMTGLGVKIVRRDEIRLLEDTDGDGYADKSTVYASGFHSIQGLAFDGESVFAMHAPLLTALRDTDGDGVADQRRDLVTGLGLPPEQNSNRLHCANGVVVGHDGWLYLALGDRGCDVRRPEGDRLVFRQGGILRCRPDGSDLHVFSGGMRNIYDVALDADLNVFVRDNENDGGDFMIRVCHSFHGADHGYPYLYYEHPDEAMPPLADLGRGSSAGGVCYRERQFPREYRGALLFCEWGRAVVRYPRRRSSGGGFAPTSEHDFVTAAESDPYGLKPTDLVVDRDGSLLISDWGDGQRPKRGRGRIYRISYPRSKDAQEAQDAPTGAIARLNSPGYQARVEAQRRIARSPQRILKLKAALKKRSLTPRARKHAVWVLAGEADGNLEALFRLAESDSEVMVRIQCVKAIADRIDPILARHRLDAGRGAASVAGRLARLAESTSSAALRFEVIVALGRLRWKEAPAWLAKNLTEADGATAHAIVQTLRRVDNWPAVLEWLDAPPPESAKPLNRRELGFRAIAEQANAVVVDGLLTRLRRATDPRLRGNCADTLGRAFKKPAPWVYWGFRPPPRKPNTIAWSHTPAIQKGLNRALRDREHAVRAAALKRMVREHIPVEREALTEWLNAQPTADHASLILEVLAKDRGPAVTELEKFLRKSSASLPNRMTAMALYVKTLPADRSPRLLVLAKELNDDSVLAALLKELGARKVLECEPILLAKLKSGSASVRAAAIGALAGRQVARLKPRLRVLLRDRSPLVRAAAAAAAGSLAVKSSADLLLAQAKDEDAEARRAALVALRKLSDSRAAPHAVAALGDSQTRLAGLEYLAKFGGAEHLSRVVQVARAHQSAIELQAAVHAIHQWRQRSPDAAAEVARFDDAIAEIHAAHGTLIRWQVFGPLAPSEEDKAGTADLLRRAKLPAKWLLASGADATVRVGNAIDGQSYFGISRVMSKKPQKVEILASASGAMKVWLNGRVAHQRTSAGAFRPDSDRFTVSLKAGENVLVLRATARRKSVRWHARMRPRSSVAEHEQLLAGALKNRGHAGRGRALFLNVEKSLCLKCHQLDGRGGKIGPDLSGIGKRLSRVHLVESILQPSRSIAPSFATVSIQRADGRLLSGVRVREEAGALTIGDREGKLHTIPRGDIDAMRVQPTSTMPEGLEKRLTRQQFLDLIEFLRSQTGP